MKNGTLAEESAGSERFVRIAERMGIWAEGERERGMERWRTHEGASLGVGAPFELNCIDFGRHSCPRLAEHAWKLSI